MPAHLTLPLDRPDQFRPPPAYRRMSTDEPVARVALAGGGEAWLVTGDAAVRAVLSDPRFGVVRPGQPTEETPSPMGDGEGHLRFRRLVAGLLTGRRVAEFRPRIVQIAEELVTGMLTEGPGADLVTSLCRPLPLTVICELLGVDVGDRDRFHHWVEAALALVVPVDNPDAVAADVRTVTELWEYMGRTVHGHYHEPNGSLLSQLVTGDRRSTEDEAVQIAVTVLITGYVTTANALSIGLVELANSHGFASVSDDRVDGLVEEMLRKQSGPGNEALPRWAREDLVLGGRSIARDDLVLVRLEAANHDPARFADPDRFDPARVANHHLAFGHGHHHCLGAGLARAELRAAVTTIAARCPGLAVMGALNDVEWTGHPFENGPAHIPITW